MPATIHHEPRTRSSHDVQVPQLRAHRQRRALSQQELADLARLSRTTIIKLEAGRDAWPKTVRKLARALRVNPEDLQ
jgi:DNA-binding XRE family transcriptional regulator